METKILLIEDDARSVHLMELILGSLGYQPLVAENGREGLEMARIHRPDLILLDLMLPEMDGFEFLRQARADPDIGDVPVVVTSARARSSTKKAAAELGIDAYLTKPFRKDELLDVIRSVLDE